jgi:hypothetical protein
MTRNDRSANATEAFGGSKLPATSGDDGDLLALEAQLDDLIAELAAQNTNDEQVPSVASSSKSGRGNASVGEVRTKQVEAILARLYPIERAIMAARAHTIIGLGVKARHAAYVMSQYWEEPTDQIDWEAQAIRLLIEAVCDVARKPLSLLTHED